MTEGISEKLDLLVEKFDKMQEKKQFKLPFGIRSAKGKFRRNYAVVELLRLNGAVEFKMIPIEDNTIKIGGIYYDASAEYIMRYKKYPLIILPEWNIKPLGKDEAEEIEPFSPKENFKKAEKEGMLSAPEKFILHAIKMDTVKPKGNINVKVILLIGALLVGGYVLLSYLKVI